MFRYQMYCMLCVSCVIYQTIQSVKDIQWAEGTIIQMDSALLASGFVLLVLSPIPSVLQFPIQPTFILDLTGHWLGVSDSQVTPVLVFVGSFQRAPEPHFVNQCFLKVYTCICICFVSIPVILFPGTLN